jgi:hypothetical protein
MKQLIVLERLSLKARRRCNRNVLSGQRLLVIPRRVDRLMRANFERSGASFRSFTLFRSIPADLRRSGYRC